MGSDPGHCDTDIDECFSAPCQNGAACVDSSSAAAAGQPTVARDAYWCVCAAGYEDGNCNTNTDECASTPCANSGVCTDGVAFYTCACPGGFIGDNCASAYDPCTVAEDDCDTATYNRDTTTTRVATCAHNGDGTHTCACINGFVGDATLTSQCADINECAATPCENGGVCTDSSQSGAFLSSASRPSVSLFQHTRHTTAMRFTRSEGFCG